MSEPSNPGSGAPIIPSGSPVVINVGGRSTEPASKSEGQKPETVEDWQRLSANREAFSARLAEEGQKGANRVLKSLGVPREERDAYFEQIKAGKLALAPKETVAAAARVKDLETRLEMQGKALKQYADAEFAKLPEAAQKYVAATTADDPAARLQAIETLFAHGLVQREVPAAAPPAPAAAPKPATTIGPNGPAQAPPSGSKTPFQQYQELSKQNRFLAANFYQQHAKAIEASRPTNQQ